jgi:hypothetical protein
MARSILCLVLSFTLVGCQSLDWTRRVKVYGPDNKTLVAVEEHDQPGDEVVNEAVRGAADATGTILVGVGVGVGVAALGLAYLFGKSR